jgi:hypothetical protein
MSTSPSSPIRPSGAAPSQPPPATWSSGAAFFPAASLLLLQQLEERRRLFEQQAARQALAAAAPRAASPTADLTPDQLKQIASALGGFSNFLNGATLMALLTGEQGAAGFQTELQALVDNLKKVWAAAHAAPPIPSIGEQNLADLSKNLIAALQKLPDPALGMLLYQVIGSSSVNPDRFLMNLQDLAKQDPDLAPLCDKVEKGSLDWIPPSSGAWTLTTMTRFSTAMQQWLGFSQPPDPKVCAFEPAELAGLMALLSPYMNALGQAATAPINAPLGGFAILSGLLTGLAMLPQGGRGAVDLWSSFHQQIWQTGPIPESSSETLAAALYRAAQAGWITQYQIDTALQQLQQSASKREGVEDFADGIGDLKAFVDGMFSGKYLVPEGGEDDWVNGYLGNIFGRLTPEQKNEQLQAAIYAFYSTDDWQRQASHTQQTSLQQGNEMPDKRHYQEPRG